MPATTISLGPTFRAQVERRDAHTWVALAGQLNEACNLGPLAELAPALVLDLGAVDRINSVGVRYWMDFVKAREKAGVTLTFERCSPVMVGQITMITHFMGTRSRVKSLLAPYSCTSCKAESDVVVEAAPGAQIQPTLACPKCGARMELDDLVETYADALARVTP